MAVVKAPPSLGTLQDQGRCAPPKPTRLDKLARWVKDKRAHGNAASNFRAAVWKRDQSICQVCHQRVRRTAMLDPLRGHVHHTVPRSKSKAGHYDVANGMLVCAVCHAKIHAGKVTR